MHWLDPDQLPHVTSEVERFVLNPHGDADGMILTNGMEIHFPPHLSAKVLEAVRKGDRVTARGVRPRVASLMAAVAIDTPTGLRVLDSGPPKPEKDGKEPKHPPHAHETRELEVEGLVLRALHGPKGEVRGALLEDGTIVRFPPHEAKAIAALLAPASRLAARGKGVITGIGTVIAAKEIGPSKETVRPLKGKEPKPDRPPKPHK